MDRPTLNTPLIVAIDGPAGAGKSTVARIVAGRLGLFFLDTGAMYRAITLAALDAGLDLADAQACERLARELPLDFDPLGRILIRGQAGEPAIRSDRVTANVSQLSAHAGVREAVVGQQRSIAERHGGAVAEGRDTTTVVFPETPYKFYLRASAAERARRRALQQGQPERQAKILEEIERRDALDSGRAVAPLRVAEDARVVVAEGRSAEDVADVICALLDERREPPPVEPEKS